MERNDSNAVSSIGDFKNIQSLPWDVQEIVISYLPHHDIHKVIRCSKNMYDIGLNYYRNLFFNKEYHIMKLKKRKDGLMSKSKYL